MERILYDPEYRQEVRDILTSRSTEPPIEEQETLAPSHNGEIV